MQTASYMQKLLQIEWLKLKNHRPFIIIASFFTLGVFTINYVVYILNNTINKVQGAALIKSSNPYDFYYTWQTTSYWTGWLLLLPSLLIIILVINEFTYRTNRQNIIDGWSRSQFIEVKMMLALIVAVCSTLLVVLSATLFGLLSGSSFSTHGISHVFFFFLKALSYNVIAVFISVWIRLTGFAIGSFFIYIGAENFISILLNNNLSLKLRNDYNIDLGSLGDYLPMNASDGLLTFPDNPLKTIAKSALPTDYTWLVACFAVAYLVLFFWLSKRNYLKKDL